MVKKILTSLVEYLLHASTWKGLIGLAVAAGVSITPELADKIIAAGLGVVGLIQVFVDDHDVTKTIEKK